MAYPIKIDIDLPAPTVHTEDKGFDFEHRFTDLDRNYRFSTVSGEPCVWRDPARRTIMLMPAPFTEAWKTTTGGLFARPALSHYRTDAGAVPTAWEEVAYRTGDTFLLAKGVGERIHLTNALPTQSSGKFPENQAFFFRAQGFGKGGEHGIYVEIEWGKAAVGSTTPQFKMILYHDGRFVLKKNGAEVHTGYLTPGTRDRSFLPQRYIEVMILPYRRNEILFWSNMGAYSVYTDTTYATRDPEDPANLPDPKDPHPLRANGGAYGLEGEFIITESGFASVKFPSSKGWFQLTPVSYLCSPSGGGAIFGFDVKLPYKPNAANWPAGAEITDSLDHDAPGQTAASVTPNLATDGTDDTMDWGVLLLAADERPDPAGYPNQAARTPFVYGFSVQVPPGSQDQNHTPSEKTDYIRKLTRRYGPDGSSCELEFKDPRTISEEYMQALNRPVRIYVDDGAGGENELFYGIATEPEYDEWPDGPDGVDHTPVGFTVSDFWHRFDRTMLKNIRALDGMKLHEAVNVILDRLGWPADRRDIDETEAELPADPKGEEKLVLSDQVSSGGELLRWIKDEFSTSEEPPYTWVMDFAPVLDGTAYKIKFRFKDPKNFPDHTAPSGPQPATRTYYPTQAAALAAGATKDDWARSYRRKVIEPEANWIIVAGETPDGEPIFAEKWDVASFNPDTPYGSRPLNWLGEIREFFYYNSAINSKEEAERICNSLYNRLVRQHVTAEWTAEALYDDRLFDRHKMTHDGDRRYSLVEYEVTHELETAGKVVRSGRYSGESRD